MLSNLRLKLIHHKDKIESLIDISKSLVDFAVSKSKFSLVSGGLTALQSIAGLDRKRPEIFFSPVNGWVNLYNNGMMNDIFISLLERLPGRRIPFDYDNVKMFETPVGSFIVIYEGRYDSSIRILTELNNRPQIIQWLATEKIKELNSNYLSLIATDQNNQVSISLAPLSINSITSERSNSIIEELTNSFKHNLSRSIMLYGLPGTGKTTIAQTIIDHFKFKTLKIYPDSTIELPYILELINILNIEAIILDDFDQIEMNENLLEFLETINTKVKLVIGIANVLEGFDPAVLRPGRFDDIVLINELEEDKLKELLGDLSKKYLVKTKSWPVAYIQELKKQSILNPTQLETKYQDLSDRVEKLKQSYIVEDEIEEGQKV